MIALAKRMPGIEEVIAGIQPQPPEERTEIPTSRVTELLSKFEQMLQEIYIGDIAELIHKQGDILTPAEISAVVMQAAVNKSSTLPFYHYHWLHHTVMINQLIQESYNAGYNYFVVDVTDYPLLKDLATELKGKEDKPLHLRIIGDVEEDCGRGAEHIKLTLEGNANVGLGRTARYSSFQAINVGMGCGSNATECTFRTVKSSEALGVKSVKCTFYTQETKMMCGGAAVEGNFNIEVSGGFSGYLGSPPVNCTFRTGNRMLLKRMQVEVPTGNRLIFINPDGTETIVRDYR